MFNYLTGYARPRHYRKVLVAPVQPPEGILERDRAHDRGALARAPGADPDEDELAARRAVDPGALPRLAGRGARSSSTCAGSARCGPASRASPRTSRCVSVVGRFLEHSRIYSFERPRRDRAIYIGSADLMPRNLYNRVELVTPVEDEKVRAELARRPRPLASPTTPTPGTLGSDGELDSAAGPTASRARRPARDDRAPHERPRRRATLATPLRLARPRPRHCGDGAAPRRSTATGSRRPSPAELPAADGDADGRRRRGRRRLHRAVGRLVAQASSSPRRGSSCSRPTAAASGRAAATAASSTRLWFSLPTLRRRFGDAAALAARARGAGLGRPRSATLVRGAGGRRLVPRRRLPAGLDRSGASTARWEPVADACAELGRARAPAGSLDRGRGAAPLRLADLPRRAPSTPRPPPSSRPAWRSGFARPPARARGRRSSRARRSGGSTAAGEGVEASPTAGACARVAAVLATGAALAGRRPLRRRLTVTSSHMVITEPVPDLIDELGWTGGECITDSRAMVHYFRTTPRRTDRLRLGRRQDRAAARALDGRAELDPASSPRSSAHLRPLLPAARGTRGRRTPGAGRSTSRPTHLPVVGSVDGGRVHCALRLHRPRGRALAPASAARSPRWRSTAATRPRRCAIVDPPPVRVPPEPLPLRRRHDHPRGRSCARSGSRRRAGGPGPLTRVISGLPERIGIHIGR